MNPLEKIFYESEHSSDKWQPYFDVYYRHLSKYAGTDMNLVEVGVQKGGSLEMWSTFLGAGSKITGIDIDPECANLKYRAPNIEVVIGDQGSEDFWNSFLTDDRKIDIFIDDGGHYMDQQILTFQKVFRKISPGGIYICEDCHTSYMPHNGGGLRRGGTFIEFAKGMVDALHKNWLTEMDATTSYYDGLAKDLSGIFFYDSVVVFEKNGKKEMKRVFAK